MDPHSQFCHNPACPARGQRGQGNITIHSRRKQRYRCAQCRHTFTTTKDTPYFRLHKLQATIDLVACVLTLISHGCPRSAIVAALGLDERTVADWEARGGQHAQAVHEHLVEAGQVALQHVQADELWVKLLGQRVWQAMAMEVTTRLWLGGVISVHRDTPLITAVVTRVKAAGRPVGRGLLICVDGLASYVTAVRQVFRTPVRTGQPGRPKLVPVPGLLLGQVIKRRVKRQLVSVAQRVVLGRPAAIRGVLGRTGTGSGINTAYIERLNATFRGALAGLARRSRHLLGRTAQLTAQMWLVGTAYNWCWEHDSLRQVAIVNGQVREVGQTPAMAAGLTDHIWTMAELLRYQVPLPPWVPPKRRGRPPKQAARGVTP